MEKPEISIKWSNKMGTIEEETLGSDGELELLGLLDEF